MGAKKKLEIDRLFPATPLVDERRALISKHFMSIVKKLMMAADISDVEVARVIRDETIGNIFDLERDFNERIEARRPPKKSEVAPAPPKSGTHVRIPKASRVPKAHRAA